MRFKYVTKPVEIEAVRADIAFDKDIVAIPVWYVDAAIDGTIYNDDDKEMCKTKQGPVQINSGDYLIRLADGEIYPCSAGVFENKYQKI